MELFFTSLMRDKTYQQHQLHVEMPRFFSKIIFEGSNTIKKKACNLYKTTRRTEDEFGGAYLSNAFDDAKIDTRRLPVDAFLRQQDPVFR